VYRNYYVNSSSSIIVEKKIYVCMIFLTGDNVTNERLKCGYKVTAHPVYFVCCPSYFTLDDLEKY
jgi:hypothetical protein